MTEKDPKIAYKVIISIAILMLISIVVYKVYKMNLGVDDIKNYVESFGKLGPIIYIIMFSLVPLTLFPRFNTCNIKWSYIWISKWIYLYCRLELQ